MTYIIEKNYSVFNNYHYDKKPSISKWLVRLSTPCRRVLGGRNVYLSSQTYENKMSTTKRVATLFFLIVIFPAGTISFASLLIRLVTFPSTWEKKKVTVQCKQAWDLINQFNESFKSGEYDKAIQTFKQRQELGRRSDIYGDLFKIINQKINIHAPWDEVQTLLPYVKTNDAIELINHAVKVKLGDELKNDFQTLSASQIIHFVENSLRYNNALNVEECYNKLFSSSLLVDINENLLLNAIKMDLADQLISALTEMKISKALSEFSRVKIKFEEIQLRSSLFKKEQSHLGLSSLFKVPAEMEKISQAIDAIRKMNLAGQKALNDLSSPTNSWNDIQAVLTKFQTHLGAFTSLADEEEKKYIQNLQKAFIVLNESIDHLEKTKSPEEALTLAKVAKDISAEQAGEAAKLIPDINFPDLLSTLSLKKRACLIIFIEKMKSSLVNQIVQTATTQLKKEPQTV